MNQPPRRRFLKQSVAALTTLGLPSTGHTQARRARQPLSNDVLRPLAEIVLPATELKSDGIARVVANFQSWLDEFEPVAEMDHPYLSSSEIVYGPPDPRPRWQAQVEALEIEAQKEYGKAFRSLTTAERRRLIERAIRSERLESLPSPANAQHIAVGLAAFFYSSTEANDLCYEAAIGRWKCRGIESGPQKPVSLPKRG